MTTVKKYFKDSVDFKKFLIEEQPEMLYMYVRHESGRTTDGNMVKSLEYLKSITSAKITHIISVHKDGSKTYNTVDEFVEKYTHAMGYIPELYTNTYGNVYKIYAMVEVPEQSPVEKKKQAIKDAYEGTENLYPRENGWSILYDNSFVPNPEIFEIENETCTDLRPGDSTRKIIRPIALRGIENNNGWLFIWEDDESPRYVKGWNNKKGYAELIMLNRGEILEDNAADYTHFQNIDLDIKGPVF